jgi:hypothetical protein
MMRWLFTVLSIAFMFWPRKTICVRCGALGGPPPLTSDWPDLCERCCAEQASEPVEARP